MAKVNSKGSVWYEYLYNRTEKAGLAIVASVQTLREMTLKCYKQMFSVMEIVCMLIIVVIIQLCACVSSILKIIVSFYSGINFVSAV